MIQAAERFSGYFAVIPIRRKLLPLTRRESRLEISLFSHRSWRRAFSGASPSFFQLIFSAAGCSFLPVLPTISSREYGDGFSHSYHDTYTLPESDLTAPENQPLAAKTDENSGVRWVSVRQLEQYVTEPYMLYIYRKIGARLGAF